MSWPIHMSWKPLSRRMLHAFLLHWYLRSRQLVFHTVTVVVRFNSVPGLTLLELIQSPATFRCCIVKLRHDWPMTAWFAWCFVVLLVCCEGFVKLDWFFSYFLYYYAAESNSSMLYLRIFLFRLACTVQVWFICMTIGIIAEKFP